MKEVSEEKYLGDYISTKGLADSIIVTIDKRMKKANTAIMEVRAVVEDCRAMVTGGISTGLEIWEMAVTPYLLNNCDTWNNLPLKAIEMLDNLQNDFLRSLLATPRTCPTPSLMWETGTMTMENRIIKKKLLFYHHLLHLPQGSLAWQICQVQTKLALPGLVQECKELLKNMELPNVEHCSQLQWKQAVNKAMKTKNKNFRSRRWGSSLPVCALLTVRSSPHRHEQKFFGARVWGGGFSKYFSDQFSRQIRQF